ncbi:methylase [Aliidiomarina minuta]|uniref:Methylase n=1 Tax=Aliidiomarina minuta TaxID=880057 RepID=A0A432W403_9GAMM|nr:DUF938 domain-containing protein [Aliidiomarina minuta]RUO24080.1 methylase [Aliidiomarina minuta]
MLLPFSQACENNKSPILDVLQPAFSDSSRVLEVGSGTGQHAVYFAQHMPHLTWQCSDQARYLEGLQQRIEQAALPNLPPPIELDITNNSYNQPPVDAIFSANTLHIMSWPTVQQFFQRLPDFCNLNSGNTKAALCIYGPFNYNGAFTSDSNQAFDRSLRARDPQMGIRDIEDIQPLAKAQGFHLHKDHSMPANNRLLHFLRD